MFIFCNCDTALVGTFINVSCGQNSQPRPLVLGVKPCFLFKSHHPKTTDTSCRVLGWFQEVHYLFSSTPTGARRTWQRFFWAHTIKGQLQRAKKGLIFTKNTVHLKSMLPIIHTHVPHTNTKVPFNHSTACVKCLCARWNVPEPTARAKPDRQSSFGRSDDSDTTSCRTTEEGRVSFGEKRDGVCR